MTAPPEIRHRGLVPYESALAEMQELTAKRTGSTPDQVWFLEHPPVYTLGLGARREHVLATGDVPVVQADRGGQVTYHGPGQLVTYVMLDLKRGGIGIRVLVARLEDAVMDTLLEWGIRGQRRDGAPGVYVDGTKIAAVGIRVRRGCSYHGIALNVNMDLAPFGGINPCGYPGLTVTQLRDLGVTADCDAVALRLWPHLLERLGFSTKDVHKKTPSRDQRGRFKTARIPIRVVPTEGPLPHKPAWIRGRAPTHPRVAELKRLLREHALHTVCEEASCPNLGECFAHGTATFMIMGDICTRRCPFCDVAHGRPRPLDEREPDHLANAVARMRLNYVVITSVDRDDLRDGGASHFARCVAAVRRRMPGTRVEILTPDFRRRMERALDALSESPPDVFNHNLETVPRLYRKARPGADYAWSLDLICRFKARHPEIPTKSGLMLGLGEEMDEVKQVLRDLRSHDCDMLTVGQYLQPSRYHLRVERFVPPDEFDALGEYARYLGFTNVASAPMVRSSYHADRQAEGKDIDWGRTSISC